MMHATLLLTVLTVGADLPPQAPAPPQSPAEVPTIAAVRERMRDAAMIPDEPKAAAVTAGKHVWSAWKDSEEWQVLTRDGKELGVWSVATGDYHAALADRPGAFAAAASRPPVDPPELRRLRARMVTRSRAMTRGGARPAAAYTGASYAVQAAPVYQMAPMYQPPPAPMYQMAPRLAPMYQPMQAPMAAPMVVPRRGTGGGCAG